MTNFFVLTLGTGVGGGAMIDGKLLKGSQGFGGELGHISVFPRGYPCGCGSMGCLEVYASKSGLTKAAKKMQRTFPLSPIFENENPEKLVLRKFSTVQERDPYLVS